MSFNGAPARLQLLGADVRQAHHLGGDPHPDDRVPLHGRLRVILDRVFPFEEIVAAQAWMLNGRRIGKVVLELD